MRSYLARLDRPGRAAIGVVLGGGIALAGCLVMWAEGGPLGEADDWGSRLMLALALGLIGLGVAMVDVTDRRRWRRWAMVLAIIGCVGALFVWLVSLADWSAWTIRTEESPPLPAKGSFALPVYIVGCLVAAIAARRMGRGRDADQTSQQP